MAEQEKPGENRFTDRDGNAFRIVPEDRMRQLEAVERSVSGVVMTGSMQLRDAREAVARLRADLEFYASRKGWRLGRVLADGGRRARKALGMI